MQKSAAGQKKVLHLLCDSRPLETFPSVYNALYLWQQKGWKNVIATAANCEDFREYLAEVVELGDSYFKQVLKLARLIRRFEVIIVYEFRDVEILRLATLFALGPRWRKLVHHSLELPTLYFQRSGLGNAVHKRAVILGMSKVDELIIQDELRFSLAKQLFPDLARRKHYFVPNSYIPSIEPMGAGLPWYDDIRKKSRWLILYTGALERWTLPLTMLAELKELRDVNFVFSGWCRDGSLQETIDFCSGCDHLQFSTYIKSRAELNYMVSNCDIGFAYYASDIDDNITYMGMSSGKIHKYLSLNKPVLVNKVPLLSDVIENRRFGVLMRQGSVRKAIYDVIANYDLFQQSIAENYSAEYGFEAEYARFTDAVSG